MNWQSESTVEGYERGCLHSQNGQILVYERSVEIPIPEINTTNNKGVLKGGFFA